MSTAENGNTVKVHYKGTLNDGTVFDSSYERAEPLGFTLGSGDMIPGFNDAVVGMTVGQTKSVTLTPDQAYGQSDPTRIGEVEKSNFPDDFEFAKGTPVQSQTPQGPVFGTIYEVKDSTVMIDFNHPMAGKDLNFEIELVDVGE